MNNFNEINPLQIGLQALFSPSVIQGIVSFANALDELERRDHYRNNAEQVLQHLYRLYEQRQITRDQLLKMIEILIQENTINIDIRDLKRL